MGQRMNYYHNSYGKNLQSILEDNYEKFRFWYLNRNQISILDNNQQYGNNDLLLFLDKNKSLKISETDNKIVGEFMCEFVYDFVWEDSYNTKSDSTILKCLGPDIKIWRWEKSRDLILETQNIEFITLWDNLLFSGRSFFDKQKFERIEKNDSLKIGFLHYLEQKRLLYFIDYYFGNIESIKKKYWTSNDWEIYENKISLSNYSKQTEGLEITLTILNEVIGYKNDLITTIE